MTPIGLNRWRLLVVAGRSTFCRDPAAWLTAEGSQIVGTHATKDVDGPPVFGRPTRHF